MSYYDNEPEWVYCDDEGYDGHSVPGESCSNTALFDFYNNDMASNYDYTPGEMVQPQPPFGHPYALNSSWPQTFDQELYDPQLSDSMQQTPSLHTPQTGSSTFFTSGWPSTDSISTPPDGKPYEGGRPSCTAPPKELHKRLSAVQEDRLSGNFNGLSVGDQNSANLQYTGDAALGTVPEVGRDGDQVVDDPMLGGLDPAAEIHESGSGDVDATVWEDGIGPVIHYRPIAQNRNSVSSEELNELVALARYSAVALAANPNLYPFQIEQQHIQQSVNPVEVFGTNGRTHSQLQHVTQAPRQVIDWPAVNIGEAMAVGPRQLFKIVADHYRRKLLQTPFPTLHTALTPSQSKTIGEDLNWSPSITPQARIFYLPSTTSPTRRVHGPRSTRLLSLRES
jgi:hypothetical protein